MKRSKITGALSTLLVASMGVGLCACGGGTSDGNNGGSSNSSNDAQHFFKSEYVSDLPDNFSGDIGTVRIQGDTLYYYVYGYEEGTQGGLYSYGLLDGTEQLIWETEYERDEDDTLLSSSQVNEYVLSPDGEMNMIVTETKVTEESKNSDYSQATLDDVLGYMVDSWGYDEASAQEDWDMYYASEYTDEDGNVDYGLAMRQFNLDYDSTSKLIKLDADGNVISESEMEEVSDDDTYTSWNDIALDADGNLYMQMNSWSDTEDLYYIDIYDKDGNQIGKVDLDDYGFGLMTGYDGKVGYLEWGDNGDYDVYTIDVTTMSAEKSYTLPSGGSDVIAYDEDHVLVTDGSSLCLYNIKDQSKEVYLNWMDYNISSSSVSVYGLLSDGSLAVYTNTYTSSGNQSEIVILTEVDESEVSVAETIKIAYLWLDSEVEEKAIEFNKKHEDYHISFVDFYDEDEEDWDAMLSSFTTAVASDPTIDVVIFDDYSQVVNFASKGLMVDLYDFIDNDSDLSRDDFLPNILTACETDGKLAVLPTAFSLTTVVGKSEDVGEESGWSVDDMLSLLASKPDDTQLFYGMTRDSALETCLNLGYKAFIDTENATCDFNNDSFIQILEFANMFPEEFEYEEDVDETVLMNTGKVLLSEYYLSDFESIQMYTEVFGGDLTYIGYPTTEGNGALLSMNNMYGITKNCEHPEAAWEFLRQFYLPTTDSENDEYYSSWGFSVRKDEFEKFCTNAMKETDTDSWGWGDFEVQIKPATQQQVDEVKELVYNTTAVNGAMSSDILDIIKEEAAYYFSGEQSAEDVAAKIQSRMQIYLSETK